MEIANLDMLPGLGEDPKLTKQFHALEKLLLALDQRDLPASLVAYINAQVNAINTFSGSPKDRCKLIGKTRRHILQRAEKEAKLVPKNHYRTQWMALGMSTFGIPLGLVFGFTLDNMGFLAIGIPIGMAIGIAVGAGMDKKAEAEGRQLDYESPGA